MLAISFICLSVLVAADPAALVTGPVETVATGFGFTEGPLWLPEGKLIFSDIPADTIFVADKSVFRMPSGQSNGLTLDGADRLIACEHENRRVSRTEKDGSITVLAEFYEGKRLNSPNDVVVRGDGWIFFTDPPYGLGKRKAEVAWAGVYAISPDGKLSLIADDFVKPNGIALSPDEKTLYVADTEGNHIRAFDCAQDGTITNGRVLCEVQGPDGIKVDSEGRIWCTSDGVHVFDASGKGVGVVEIPQRPANCAFGDADGKTLYVTARTGLYKVRCATAGILP